MPLPILLDTDPGVDDALALLLALRSPELELVAVTTAAGNVGLEATTRNALLLLELRRLGEIVVMGGAFRCPGNVTPVAEFNIFVDPDAAQTVLDLGVPLRLVPLDVTERVMVRPADLNKPAAGRLAGFLHDLLEHTF